MKSPSHLKHTYVIFLSHPNLSFKPLSLYITLIRSPPPSTCRCSPSPWAVGRAIVVSVTVVDRCPLFQRLTTLPPPKSQRLQHHRQSLVTPLEAKPHALAGSTPLLSRLAEHCRRSSLSICSQSKKELSRLHSLIPSLLSVNLIMKKIQEPRVNVDGGIHKLNVKFCWALAEIFS